MDLGLSCSSACEVFPHQGLNPCLLHWQVDSLPLRHQGSPPETVMQPLSHVQLFATPWTTACQAFLAITDSQNLLKLMSNDLVMPSNHLILCHPLLLPSILPSIRVISSQFFTSGGQSIGVSASASVFPLNSQNLFPFGLTGLISFQSKGPSSLLQHHSLKASVLWCSAFFMVQLSHSFMTTRKTIALTIWTFVGKVMSVLFNMLSRFVIAFLPRSKYLNFKAEVTICSDLGAQENKSVTFSIVSPSICHKLIGLDAMIFVF